MPSIAAAELDSPSSLSPSECSEIVLSWKYCLQTSGSFHDFIRVAGWIITLALRVASAQTLAE